MPQFDFLTMSTQTLSFLAGLLLFYYNNINIGLLYFAKIKKMRSKKTKNAIKRVLKTDPNLKTMVWTSNISYQFYLQSKLT